MMKQMILPKCSYQDITEEKNSEGGQIFLAANLFRALWLALASSEEKYGYNEKKNHKKIHISISLYLTETKYISN